MRNERAAGDSLGGHSKEDGKGNAHRSADENRALMPTVAGIVDAFRGEFKEVRVTYCSENGRERGRKSE